MNKEHFTECYLPSEIKWQTAGKETFASIFLLVFDFFTSFTYFNYFLDCPIF